MVAMYARYVTGTARNRSGPARDRGPLESPPVITRGSAPRHWVEPLIFDTIFRGTRRSCVTNMHSSNNRGTRICLDGGRWCTTSPNPSSTTPQPGPQTHNHTPAALQDRPSKKCRFLERLLPQCPIKKQANRRDHPRLEGTLRAPLAPVTLQHLL